MKNEKQFYGTSWDQRLRGIIKFNITGVPGLIIMIMPRDLNYSTFDEWNFYC